MEKGIKQYIAFRDGLKEEFMDSYEGLNINGTDYRTYVFNFFEVHLQKLYLDEHGGSHGGLVGKIDAHEQGTIAQQARLNHLRRYGF